MKKFFTMLTVLLVASFISVIYVSAEQKTITIELAEVDGEVIQDGNELTANSSFSLDELKIQHKEGNINGSGVITQNGVKSTISLKGELYPVLGEGYYANNLLIGDIDSTENYNVLQFRLETAANDSTDKNQTVSTHLRIVLEDKETGEWVHFKQEVDEQLFESFFQGANSLVKNEELEEREIAKKVASLLNMDSKAIHGEKTHKNIQVEQSGTADTEGNKTFKAPISTQIDDLKVNFSELNRLLNDLKDPYNTSRSVKLTNYNLPEALFKGNGWKKDVNLDNSPGWGYYANRADQGSFTVSQIAVFQHDGRFGGWDQDGLRNSYRNIFDYIHGMLVEYDHYTKEVKVMYYDFGITLRELHFAQHVPSGSTEYSVFTSQDLQGKNLTKRGTFGGLIKYVAGKIPYGSEITNVWSVINSTRGTEMNLGTKEEFIGGDFWEQREMHGDDVYRIVSGNLHDYDLAREGANAFLKGEIHSGDGRISLTWSYNLILGTNL
ncbi:hypothetical protein [Paucisalibacillus globulus]|uniref:hypothetical protein n=1 Tax=Paucisalibacillus globulus TaxID=351095 RepID=UPI00042722E4|nr:hypothetical protein [Paucisalibacillus globulus]